MLRFHLSQAKSPLGDMMIVTDDQGWLRALEWTDLNARMERLLARQYKDQPFYVVSASPQATITHALDAYFSGNLNALDELKTQSGGTDFQRRVWQALRTIAVGQTKSYSDIAIAIGNPKSVRAIGLANGANPIGIVVPCHRVIGANGSMTGYGGGIARKEWLLRHEGAVPNKLL